MSNIFETTIAGDLDQVIAFSNHPNFDINARDRFGKTALYYAAQENHPTIIKFFLSNDDTDLDRTDNDGISPLAIASSKGHLDAVKALFSRSEKGRCPDLESYDMQMGYNPLIRATISNHEEVVKYLLDNGANRKKEIVNKSGKVITAHKLAIHNEYKELVKVFEEYDERELRSVEFMKLVYESDTPDNLNKAYELLHKGIDMTKLVSSYEITSSHDFRSESFTPLSIACYRGQIDMVKYLINNKANINQVCEDSRFVFSSLMSALSGGFTEIAILLMDNKADVNIFTEYTSPLTLATELGKIDVVKRIIDEKADLEVRMKYSSLHIATEKGFIDILKLLMTSGMSANKSTGSEHSYETALHIASRSRNLELVNVLLEAGGEIIANSHKQTPIDIAKEKPRPKPWLDVDEDYMKIANTDNTELIDILNKAQSRNDENTRSYRFAELVERATWNQHIQEELTDDNPERQIQINSINSANKILDQGINPNIRGYANLYPLQITCRWGDIDMVKKLIDMKSNVRQIDLNEANRYQRDAIFELLLPLAKDINFEEFLETAIERNDVKRLNLLIDAKANIKQFGTKMIDLASSIEGDHVEVIKTLLNASAPIKMSKKNILNATKSNNIKIVKVLIDSKADVNMRDDDGQTALIIAQGNDNQEIEKILVDAGAIQNNYLRSIAFMATLLGNPNEAKTNIARNLLVRGIDLDHQDTKGNNVLMYACKQGLLDLVKGILNQKANVNTTNLHKSTPLHEIMQHCWNETMQYKKDIVDLLILHKADVNKANDENETAIMWGNYKLTYLDQNEKSHQLWEISNYGYESIAKYTCIDNTIIESLIKANANVNMASNKGKRIINNVIDNGNVEALQLLIKARADVNFTDQDNQSPLWRAISFKDPSEDICSSLFEDEINVKKKNKDVNMAIVTSLIKAGADVNKKNKDGLSLSDEARELDNKDLIEVLKQS